MNKWHVNLSTKKIWKKHRKLKKDNYDLFFNKIIESPTGFLMNGV